MNRYFLHLSFLGTPYHGWQIQPNAITVQSVLEDALTRLLRQTVSLTGCGRTDAGVHARMFFAHFDTESYFSPEESTIIVHRLNAFLSQDIVVHSLRMVKPEVHSRFSALSRTYQYYISTRKDPFIQGLSWYYPYGVLDQERLNNSAGILLQYSDFACFSKKDTDIVGSTCKLQQSYWVQEKELLIYTVTANRFLRNMVRAIVGTLVEIGRGKWDEKKLVSILESRDRCMAGESVPAQGLYLTNVKYPEGIFVDS
ncbi:MAG: tRNA pseudouridine(38-40) synthase TruA [Bacteroidales bacterium]